MAYMFIRAISLLALLSYSSLSISVVGRWDGPCKHVFDAKKSNELTTKTEKFKKYYDLKNDPSKKSEYEEYLKDLSNETNSRTFFRGDKERKKLHKEIIAAKLSKYETQEQPIIHFLLGSIGSGKTSMKDELIKDKEKDESFIFINFDELKKHLPEYELLKKSNPEKAAYFVQSESAVLAGDLLRGSLKKGYNILFEKNVVRGQNNEFQLSQDLKSAFKRNYIVNINIVFLDNAKTAIKRVGKRAQEIGRFVPDEKVIDTFNSLFPYFNEIYQSISKENFLINLFYNGAKYHDYEKDNFLISFVSNEHFESKNNSTMFLYPNFYKLLSTETKNNLKIFDLFKKAFFKESTEDIIKDIEATIKNKKMRDEAISIIELLHLKNIRNTSKI